MINLGKIINNPLGNKINPLSDSANFTASAINSFMVKPETPLLTEDGTIDGFLFDIKGSESVELQSDITDHWTEANSTIQDHIALKPIEITLNGYVGEVANYRRNRSKLDTILEDATRGTEDTIYKTTSAGSYFLPKLTTQAQSIANSVSRLYDIYNKARDTKRDLWSTFDGSNASQVHTQQQKAFQFFKKCWESRQLFTIQTPFETFKNMAIVSISATQDEDTKYISSFELRFKQIRFALTKTRELTDKEKSEQRKIARLAKQASEQKDKGVQGGTSRALQLLRSGVKSLTGGK